MEQYDETKELSESSANRGTGVRANAIQCEPSALGSFAWFFLESISHVSLQPGGQRPVAGSLVQSRSQSPYRKVLCIVCFVEPSVCVSLSLSLCVCVCVCVV